jgi:hypothetical protein
MSTQIKVGDKVKCFVSINDKQGNEKSFWAVGECYYIGDKVLAFEGDDGHIYGVNIDQVEVA